jgi:hypothetical protein
MIALAGGGVIGWIVAGEPVTPQCAVAADLIGAAMMVPKTYRDPSSETLATFASPASAAPPPAPSACRTPLPVLRSASLR